MINYLQGTVQLFGNPPSELSLVTTGIGYHIKVPQRTLRAVKPSAQATFFISTRVKEDSIELFGFQLYEEKKLFELLTTVSGVGPAMALNILEHSADQIIRALKNADLSFFTAVPRIGKKVAQKLIIELTPKLGSHQELNLTPLSSSLQTALEAVVSLGISETQARQALDALQLPDTTASTDAITLILKHIGSHR